MGWRGPGVIGTGLLAIVALVAMIAAAVALGATKTKTVSSGVISQGFGHGGAIVQSVKFKKKGKIKDVNVSVALTTNQNSDFTFLAQAPNGRSCT